MVSGPSAAPDVPARRWAPASTSRRMRPSSTPTNRRGLPQRPSHCTASFTSDLFWYTFEVNTMLAEELVRTGGGNTTDTSQKPSSGRERVQVEALRQELERAKRQLETLKAEKAQIEAEATNQRNLAGKLESDLKSLSDAYNSLEQANYRLDTEVKALRQGGNIPYPDIEAIKAQAKEEAEKDSEAELNDLLVCLGQEQTKVEKLSARLAELGEDVDTLLQGIGVGTAIPDDDD